MNFLVLGPHLVEKSTVPLLQVVQLIEIIDVFERMDVLFVLILFMGLGIKMAAFFVGAVTRPAKNNRYWFEEMGHTVGGCYICSFAYFAQLYPSYVGRHREDASHLFDLPDRNTASSLSSHACSSETKMCLNFRLLAHLLLYDSCP